MDDAGYGIELVSTLSVIRAAVASDVGRLRENEPLVREGRDPEGVHQARVATRRLRSQLRTFGRALKKGAVTELVDELRWLGTLLGSVRDLDVLGERLDEESQDLGEESRRPVLRRVGIERQEAFAGLIVALGSERYRRLTHRLDRAVMLPPVKDAYAQRPASDVLLPQVRRRWRDLEHAAGALGVAPHDDELHHVRILSKRARYAAEIAAPFGPAELEKLGKRAAKIQKVLGELNDGSRAVAWLEGLKASPWPRGDAQPAGADPLVAVELLLAAEHQANAAARAAWPGAFERARDQARVLQWSESEEGPRRRPPEGADPGSPGGAPGRLLQAVPVTT